MRFGNRDHERFWIVVIVRFAFGFLFLIAALNIFTYWDQKNPAPTVREEPITFVAGSLQRFVDDQSVIYENTWINFKWKWWPLTLDEETGVRVAMDLGIYLVRGFLYVMPFIFALLALSLLTGIFYRLALRLSAFYLVLLGLGKYMATDSATTANDFMYAAFICIALFLASKPASAGEPRAEESGVADSKVVES